MGSVKYGPGYRFGSLVIVERLGQYRGSTYVLVRCDCGSPDRRVNLSNLRTGVTVRCADRAYHVDPRHKGADVTYWGAHNRVKRERGSARGHQCVACGEPAKDWAYAHADPDEMRATEGRERGPYSAEPAHYEPRCKNCHSRFDSSRARLPDGLSLVHLAFWTARNREAAARGAYRPSASPA
jgi:hypothetical protein